MATDQRFDTFVASPQRMPVQPGLPISVDPDNLVSGALREQTQIVQNYLRSITPMMQVLPPEGEMRRGYGYASPGETAARTDRYKFSVASITGISALTSAGLVLLAYANGYTNELTSVATWLALSGIFSGVAVSLMHRQDSVLTPEGIERQRQGYQAVVDQMDAESRQTLAGAYATAITLDARARAYTQRTQAHAMAAETQRLAAPRPAPAPRPQAQFGPVRWDEPAFVDDEQAVGTVQGTVEETVSTSGRGLFDHSPTTVDPLRTTVLTFVASLYEDGVVDGNGLILVRLPWSSRGSLAPAERDRVQDALRRLEPPLIEIGAGNRAYLNRVYSRRQLTVNAVGAALDALRY